MILLAQIMLIKKVKKRVQIKKFQAQFIMGIQSNKLIQFPHHYLFNQSKQTLSMKVGPQAPHTLERTR